MPTTLYLDNARLGPMTPRAQQAHCDFVRLAGEEAGSLLVERFVRDGVEAWPQTLRQRYTGLADWHGIGPLKQSLRMLAGTPADLPVLVASRTAQLMRFAARLLFLTCRNVLITDVGWPGYHDILQAECRLASRATTAARVRQAILVDRACRQDIVDLFAAEAERNRCDGLFLPAVSNEGVRLPVEEIVRAVESRLELRFVIIDGAQEFCHATADLGNEYCDLYLTGSHKWLGGYLPLGLGFYGRRRSRHVIETILDSLMRNGEIDDPLLRFATQLENECLESATETVNLGPLFSCQGAVADSLGWAGNPVGTFGRRLDNAKTAAEAAPEVGWRPLLPDAAFRSGILLLQAERPQARRRPPEEVRRAFQDQGVALTAYDSGLIRLSTPAGPWESESLAWLRTALQRVAG